MSVARTAFARSLRQAPCSRRSVNPSLPLIRSFTKPTSAAMSAEDEEKHRAKYEKHRVEVDPKLAGIDESFQFTEPKKWDKDPGHDVVGAGHGRHNKRTLASLSMDGKVCVVTGAARGLGNMMARTFVESGANAVALIDLNKKDAEEAAKDLVDWFVKHGEAKEGEIQAVGYGCDVANEQSVKDTFASIEKDFGGKIDCMVSAAGIVENFVAHEYPSEKVKKLLDINVMEAAVRHMARSLAVEWAKQGIRVNCLAPGYTLTNLTKVILDNNPVLRDEWLHRIPMGRLADPSDLKGAIVLLGSDSSKYITGSEITVDGGYVCL